MLDAGGRLAAWLPASLSTYLEIDDVTYGYKWRVSNNIVRFVAGLHLAPPTRWYPGKHLGKSVAAWYASPSKGRPRGSFAPSPPPNLGGRGGTTTRSCSQRVLVVATCRLGRHIVRVTATSTPTTIVSLD